MHTYEHHIDVHKYIHVQIDRRGVGFLCSNIRLESVVLISVQ